MIKTEKAGIEERYIDIVMATYQSMGGSILCGKKWRSFQIWVKTRMWVFSTFIKHKTASPNENNQAGERSSAHWDWKRKIKSGCCFVDDLRSLKVKVYMCVCACVSVCTCTCPRTRTHIVQAQQSTSSVIPQEMASYSLRQTLSLILEPIDSAG